MLAAPSSSARSSHLLPTGARSSRRCAACRLSIDRRSFSAELPSSLRELRVERHQRPPWSPSSDPLPTRQPWTAAPSLQPPCPSSSKSSCIEQGSGRSKWTTGTRLGIPPAHPGRASDELRPRIAAPAICARQKCAPHSTGRALQNSAQQNCASGIRGPATVDTSGELRLFTIVLAASCFPPCAQADPAASRRPLRNPGGPASRSFALGLEDSSPSVVVVALRQNCAFAAELLVARSAPSSHWSRRECCGRVLPTPSPLASCAMNSGFVLRSSRGALVVGLSSAPSRLPGRQQRVRARDLLARLLLRILLRLRSRSSDFGADERARLAAGGVISGGTAASAVSRASATCERWCGGGASVRAVGASVRPDGGCQVAGVGWRVSS